MKSALLLATTLACTWCVTAQTPKPAKPKAKPEPEVAYPPALPGGKEMVTDTTPEFLQPPTTLLPGVVIAKTPPTVDFAYFPGQTYRGNPWSNWGDSLFANGKYYASIGDHLAPSGTAFIYEFDPATKRFRQLVDVKKLLGLPAGRYTPGRFTRSSRSGGTAGSTAARIAAARARPTATRITRATGCSAFTLRRARRKSSPKARCPDIASRPA